MKLTAEGQTQVERLRGGTGGGEAVKENSGRGEAFFLFFFFFAGVAFWFGFVTFLPVSLG